MKKIKKLSALIVAFAMIVMSFASLIACATEETPGGTDDPHVCGHVCTTCGKCKDATCTDEVCKEKCPGHTPTTPAEHECKHVCPEPECGKCLDSTCTDKKCEEKCPGHEQVGEHECEDKCPTCDKCTTECEEPECEEKCPGDHEEEPETYTITLEVGAGTLPAGAQTTFTTNADGMLDLEEGTYLPAPTATTAHWHFLGWYDDETAGNEVIEDETVFTEDTTIYARYGRDDGLWSGENSDVWKHGLSRNSGASGAGLIAEYWLGGGSVSVVVGEKLAVAMNGKLIEHYLWQPVGVEPHKSSGKNDYVTVTVEGDLKVYVKLYEHATDPDNWTVEWAGATKVETGSEVPEGCDAFTVTWGTNSITFYLVDASGVSVGKDRFSQFCIYTFNSELFGNWSGATTKGVLAENMTSTVTASVEGWIFRWGSGFGQQTKNITGLKSGSTYLIELKGHQVDAVVTELKLA